MKSNHCVYELRSPIGMIYVGITKDLRQRLYQHSRNKLNNIFKAHSRKHDLEFEDYDVYVICQNLTKKEAQEKEEDLILEHEENGVSLNYAKRTDIGLKFEVNYPNGDIKLI